MGPSIFESALTRSSPNVQAACTYEVIEINDDDDELELLLRDAKQYNMMPPRTPTASQCVFFLVTSNKVTIYLLKKTKLTNSIVWQTLNPLLLKKRRRIYSFTVNLEFVKFTLTHTHGAWTALSEF